jgi:hypothetical protein
MYLNPSVTVAVTESLVPASATPTTEESSFGSVRTFRSVVAYLLSITLSLRLRIGVIVSDADVLGFGSIVTGGLVLRRLRSCRRAPVSIEVVSTEDVSTDVVAGAG